MQTESRRSGRPSLLQQGQVQRHSGGPNRSFWPDDGFGILSWNTRALLNKNGYKFNDKRRFIEKDFRQAAISSFQEVHGNRLEFKRAFGRYE
eukprot:5190589-Karenia_brevis.AAC.1